VRALRRRKGSAGVSLSAPAARSLLRLAALSLERVALASHMASRRFQAGVRQAMTERVERTRVRTA